MQPVIYKFLLKITDEQTVPLGVGAKILSVGEQFGDVFLWAICYPERGKEDRTIYIFGTGNPILSTVHLKSFIGTVITDGGNYVWHIFE